MVAYSCDWAQGLIGNGHEEIFWSDRNIKNLECGDTWLAYWVAHATLNLEVMSLSPGLGIEI